MILNKNIILTELPTSKNSQNVKWTSVVGMNIEVLYNDIKYTLYINNYNTKTGKLDIIYDDEPFVISYSHFKECKFGNILGIKSSKFKYNIGDKIQDNKRNITITEQFRNESKEKFYKYTCNICGWENGEISESHIKEGKGCSCCRGFTVVRGINDLWSTHPKIAKLLKNKTRGYELTYGYNKKEKFICPICGEEISSTIGNVINQGLSCKRCGDGISYGEKLINNLLKYIIEDFKCRCVFDWSKKVVCKENNKLNGKKEYDFYFELNGNKCIVEVHGIQHYEEAFSKISKKARSLEEEQENDRLKYEISKDYIDEYIIIDARKSELDFIKNNILNSRLAKLFDLNNIDWLKCHEYACNSLVKVACDLWNSGLKSTIEIGKIMKLDYTTISRYLKYGKELNWCEYNIKDEMIKRANDNRRNQYKRVICIETQKIYENCAEPSREFKLKNTDSISSCCRGERKTSAGYHWMFYDEYKILNNN